jgi:hypothetical protein
MRITRFIGKSRKNIAAVGISGSPIISAKLKNARIERNARSPSEIRLLNPYILPTLGLRESDFEVLTLAKLHGK